MAHALSCSAACGILPDQGSNLCLLHWQADSSPLHHQGSPPGSVFVLATNLCAFGEKNPSFAVLTDTHNPSRWSVLLHHRKAPKC